MNKKNKIKYTFMIIPFKIINNGKKIFSNDLFLKVDSNENKYNKLYKHINNAISNGSSNQYISKYMINVQKYLNHYFENELEFCISRKDNLIKISGYLEDITCYIFNNLIGFFVYDFIFDDEVDINNYCDIINLLKKIDRADSNSCFTITSNNKNISIRNDLDIIVNNCGFEVDLFFQHNSSEYVSAIMLNSFSFDCMNNDREVSDIEKYYYLECLKKSKSSDYEVLYNQSEDVLHTFEGIYWGFSTQGIGNVNYFSSVERKAFIDSSHDRIKKEYLLMMMLLLNQEYTLIDFCINFSEFFDGDNLSSMKKVYENSNRLYKFKILNTYTIVSHLDHYRDFYKMFYKVLDIDQLLKEVDDKQNAIFQSYENYRLSKAQKRESIVMLLIAIAPIALVIPDLAINLNSDDLIIVWSTIVGIGVYILVAAAIILFNIFRKK